MAHNFNEENRVKSNWWQTKKVGDKIQGTFIGKRQIPNQLSGTDQWVYELLLEDGDVWNVGGKPAIDIQMRHVKVGQIVEFRFIEERPATKAGMSATKIIGVYQDPNVVNEKWLQEQEQMTMGEKSEKEPKDDINFGDGEKNEPSKESQINDLAREKLGITDTEKVKIAVMEKTNLAFLPVNYDKIIGILKAL